MKEKGREIKDAADRAVVCICRQQSSEDAMLLRIQRWLYLISLVEFVLFQGGKAGAALAECEVEEFSRFDTYGFCQFMDILSMVYLIRKEKIYIHENLACFNRERRIVLMMKEKNNSGMPDSEKEAAIGLLITVFEIHDKKKALYKALEDFADVYGDEIPGWLQHLYDCLQNSEDNRNKTDVIRNFAEQNKIEIIV